MCLGVQKVLEPKHVIDALAAGPGFCKADPSVKEMMLVSWKFWMMEL